MKKMSNYSIVFTIIILSVIAYIVSNAKITTVPSNVSGNAEAIPVDHNSTEGQIYDRFFSSIVYIHSLYNLSVPIALILAVIQRESNLLFKTKQNKDVLGDDGHSIGYMQVSLPAIKDVNQNRNTDFVFNDLYNESKNLTIGSLYLDLCYQTAINDSPNEPLRIALKKYNGGRDETSTSKNSMADVYSQKTISFYNKYAEIT